MLHRNTLTIFQKPYSLDSQSEQSIEIIDTPIAFDTDKKSANLKQIGRSDTDGNSNGITPQVSDSDPKSIEQDWHLRDLPEGVKARIGKGYITGRILKNLDFN